MTIESEVADQNIVAGQAEWEGLFQCPYLAVNNGTTKISKENAIYLDKVKEIANMQEHL